MLCRWRQNRGTGKPYSRVAAMHSNESLDTHPGMEDNGGLLLEFARGGHAVIHFDYLHPKAAGTGRVIHL